LNSNILTGFPVVAIFAYFKKFVTLTPGISFGDWNDINIPFLALSSVFSPFMFSPSNIISPSVCVYSGFANITLDSVDLPAPFGPIITCTSPLFIFRSNPFIISLSPAFACKFFISNNVSLILITPLYLFFLLIIFYTIRFC